MGLLYFVLFHTFMLVSNIWKNDFFDLIFM
jgi:hypothetical protein